MQMIRMTAAIMSSVIMAIALVSSSSGQNSSPGSDQTPSLVVPRATVDDPSYDRTGLLPRRHHNSDRKPSATAELRAKIGQMLMIGFPGINPGDEWPYRIATMIRGGQINGVILYSQNVVDPRQLKKLTSVLDDAGSTIRPFIGVDQEGGAIQRLTKAKGFVGLPSANEIASIDQANAYRLYRRSALELANFGINLNFGPVVDLNIDPNSPAIGRLGRSFSRDPKIVIAFARQFIDAHSQAGVLTVAKHFPGNGSAAVDPHDQPVNITKTWQAEELVPYRDLIGDHFAEMIMVGHLIHPSFSDGDLPASLSRKAIDGVLRGELGYQGIVVTDDLDMGAIRERFGIADAAVRAVAAGADMIIVANTKAPNPNVVDEITSAISQAVAVGRISGEAIDRSYQRILAAKRKIAGQWAPGMSAAEISFKSDLAAGRIIH